VPATIFGNFDYKIPLKLKCKINNLSFTNEKDEKKEII
jgi:hypothetical protein